MPLTADPHPRLVLAYSAEGVTLRDRVLRTSALLTPKGVLDWPVRSVDALDPERFAPALAHGAAIVLLGTGARQQFPDLSVLAAAAAAGVGLEVMDTGAACRTYNVLVAEDRPVVLALIFPGTT